MEVNVSMIDCCNCGVLFWVTEQHDERLRTRHTSFYCPNGHMQSYTKKTELDKCKEQLADVSKQMESQQIEILDLRKKLKKKNKKTKGE